MADWTLAVEAVGPGLAALAVEDGRSVPIEDAELVDGDVEVLTGSFVALARTRETDPEHVLLVVPGDVDAERYACLAEAVSLAGLPDPSWLPDAVARAGETLASWAPGTPATVVDARTVEVSAWPVRTAQDGIRIPASGAVDVGARLDDLLAGVVHSKLARATPEYAAAVRDRRDAASRRDAAHLARELRRARRLLSEADGDELVVTAGGVEVSVGREEFADLVGRAVRGAGETADTPVVIVADDDLPIVEHLVAATGGAPIRGDRGATLRGAAALAGPHTTPATPAVPTPRRPDRRPRWAVPALSTLLVLAVGGAGAVLAVGPPQVAGMVPVISQLVTAST